VNQVHRLLLALPARNKSALQRRTKKANVLRTRRKFRPYPSPSVRCPISKGGGFPQIPRHLHLIQYFTKNQIKRAPRTRCKGVLRFTLLTTCVSIYYVTTYLPTYRVQRAHYCLLFICSILRSAFRTVQTYSYVCKSLSTLLVLTVINLSGSLV